MKYPIFAILLFLGFNPFAQESKIDSLKNLTTTSAGIELINIYNELSWEFKNSNLDSARHYGFMALAEAEKLTDDKLLAKSSAMNSIANAYEALGKMDSSEYYHLESLNIKTILGDSLGMAASLNNLGILYDLTDKNEKSLEVYLQSLRLYEAHSDDNFQTAMVLGNIGIVLKKLEEYSRAIDYYKQALKIYNEENSEFGKTVTNGNIGSILINIGEYHESILYSEEAMEGYSALGYDRYVPYAKHNIAIALDSLGDYQNAEKNYLKVIGAHTDFENYMELASSQNALAEMYLKTKEFVKCKTLAHLAIENARSVQSAEFQIRAVKTLATAETELKIFQDATTHFKQYIVGKDSLFEFQKTKQIFELQTKYETEKKEQQIELQQAQLSEQTLTIQRNRLLQAGLGLVIISLVVIGLLIKNRIKWKTQKLLEEEKRKTREAEMNAVISSQEKERSRFARDLHDGFGQLISTLNLNLKNLKKPKNQEERETVFNSSVNVLEEMYQELKNICFDLMPQTLIKHGLDAAIQEFANRINLTGQKHIEVNIFGLENRLTDLQEISIYRITQEWVNNVIKYSDADNITIQITKDDAEITLLIEDNGMGFDKTILQEGKGNGWKNMTSRSNLLNGELELDTTPDLKGSSLILNAPIIVSEAIELELA